MSSNNNEDIGSSSRTVSRSEDITWLDFLRTAGGTVPAEQNNSTTSSNGVDRKRRHAGSSPDRRGYPYPPSYSAATGRRTSGTTAASTGASRATAIDLTSPSPPRTLQHLPHLQQRSSGSSDSLRATRDVMRGSGPGWSTQTPPEVVGRRDSDFTLPRWQPDAEVNKCPVCQTDFHFFYRKHHCRKCGRVVCAACSPHRITIPRQYIVQPPTGSDGDEGTPTSPGGGTLFGRNLGGGEIVRVCNPCVPDPWTPEAAAAAGVSSPRQAPVDDQGRRTSDSGTLRPDRHRNIPPPPPFPSSLETSVRMRSHTHQPATTFSRSMPQQPGASRHPFTRPQYPPSPSAMRSATHRHSQSSSSSHPHLPVPPFPAARPPLPSGSTAPPQPKQRREVREEDECPVCGTELPPGDAVREAHIQDCIASRFSAGTPSSLPSQPPPGQLTRTESGLTRQTSQTDPSATRPRATSYRPRGMAVYRATEKDCLSEDGEAQECVICFEEFQPGDEMGRMECLCKFHRACIRKWWETKGGGSCPTHDLHE